MDVRQLIGEVDGRNIIDIMDRVRVVFFENNMKKKIEGVLINANESEIRINGSSPLRNIKIENVLEISKLN